MRALPSSRSATNEERGGASSTRAWRAPFFKRKREYKMSASSPKIITSSRDVTLATRTLRRREKKEKRARLLKKLEIVALRERGFAAHNVSTSRFFFFSLLSRRFFYPQRFFLNKICALIKLSPKTTVLDESKGSPRRAVERDRDKFRVLWFKLRHVDETGRNQQR